MNENTIKQSENLPGRARISLEKGKEIVDEKNGIMKI